MSSTRAQAPFSSEPSASFTEPPDGVCAIALATRFDSTLTSARSLPITRTGFGGSDASSATPARSAAIRCADSTSSTTSSSATRSYGACTAPALIFDISNRSSTISESRIDSCSMRLAVVSTSSSSTTPSVIASDSARMPASGVRRSWLTKATSWRRDCSAARSESRISCSHTILRA